MYLTPMGVPSRRTAAVGPPAVSLQEETMAVNVTAFDPGGTTGWAVLSVYPEAMGPEPFGVWVLSQVDCEPYDWPDVVARQPELVEELRREYKQLVQDAKDYRILDNLILWSAGQFGGREDEMADCMVSLVEAWDTEEADAHVIVEDFILREFRMDRNLLSPVRVTSKFEYALRSTGRVGRARGRGAGRQFIKQPSSIALSSMTDDRLRRCGLGFIEQTAGKPHARDALRHALTWLRREKEARTYGKTLALGLVSASGI